jgi:hypothetical protein
VKDRDRSKRGLGVGGNNILKLILKELHGKDWKGRDSPGPGYGEVASPCGVGNEHWIAQNVNSLLINGEMIIA